MVGPSEADDSDGGTDEATDAGDETREESEAVGGRRVVEVGAGADVPLDDGGQPVDAESDGQGDPPAEGPEAPPEGPDVASDGGGTDTADADEETVTFEDVVADADEFESDGSSSDERGDRGPPTDDGDDVDTPDDEAPTTQADAADSVDTDDGSTETEQDEGSEGASADGTDSSAEVPPELRELLSERDDADVETIVDEVTDDSTATDDIDDSRAASGRDDGVPEHHADEPTDLATTDSGGENLAAREEAEEPAAEAEPVSMRSEMSPALAERQAFLSLLLALGAGALFATVGNVLRLSRWQTIMLLVSAGIVVLLIATFVVFRAMLAAAERNDEPYRTAYTHPLFMFLFGVTTVVTALFVGYVSRLLT